MSLIFQIILMDMDYVTRLSFFLGVIDNESDYCKKIRNGIRVLTVEFVAVDAFDWDLFFENCLFLFKAMKIFQAIFLVYKKDFRRRKKVTKIHQIRTHEIQDM